MNSKFMIRYFFINQAKLIANHKDHYNTSQYN
jgi:hypothetical protein